MNQVTTSLDSGLRSLWDYLPALIFGLLLLGLAWIVATLVKQGVSKGLRAVKFDELLVKWGAAETPEQAGKTIDTLASVFYYLTWVLFLPGIFDRFGLESVAVPITNMLQTALNYLPNIIGASIILVIGFVAAKLVKNLVYNLAQSMNVNRWMSRITGNDEAPTVSVEQKNNIASVLATIVYVLILVPIVTIALETLGIRSISEPIINVLNILVGAIPNILVAAILLGVGIAVAKFVGDLLTNLLKGTGLDDVTDSLKTSGMDLDLSKMIGQTVAVLIGLFFFVEAINVLNLMVLNTIGAAIINYVPNVLFALIILALVVVGGKLLANAVTRATGSQLSGKVVEGILLVLGVFMALSQLNLAATIVQTAFLFIIGGLSVAFALSFGLGGRDFASKQLERLDSKMKKETGKNEAPPYEGLEDKMKSAGKQVVQTKKAASKPSRRATPTDYDTRPLYPRDEQIEDSALENDSLKDGHPRDLKE